MCMTAAVAVQSDQGWVLAVDRRVSGMSEYQDVPGSKSRRLEAPGLRVVGAGDMVAVTRAFDNMRYAAFSGNIPVNVADLYDALGAGTGEDDYKLSLLIAHESDLWHAGEDGYAEKISPGVVASIGSGGDFVRGYVTGRLFAEWRQQREHVVGIIQDAFLFNPFFTTGNHADFLL